MEQIQQIVHQLLSENKNIESHLQMINEELLKNYRIIFKGYFSIDPLEVEIFYVNFNTKPQFIDTKIDCISFNYPKAEINDIWTLQSNRFGKLYFHLKGIEGIDVCLSDNEDYALCATIKSAKINDEEIWGVTNVTKRVMQIISEKENINDRQSIAKLINISNQEQQTLVYNNRIINGDYVYHTKRKMNHMEKNKDLLLHSFVNVWEKKLPLNNTERVNLYMKAHPKEDVLEVMRKQQFRFIPLDIRIKYNLSKQDHLY